MLERTLREVIAHTKQRHNGKIVLVYGDLCLGQDGEIKRLADDYSIVKVDAVNCVDCHLGGKGKSLDADPEHNLVFVGRVWLPSFEDFKFYLKISGCGCC